MKGIRLFAALAAFAGVLLLPACAQPPMTSSTTPPSAETCDAARVQNAVGQPGNAQLVEAARVQAGASTARMVRHDQMVTREYMVGRLTLWLNADGRVRAVNCG